MYCKDPECPDNRTTHGPDVWAHGRQAYTHLALTAAASHDALRLHMAQVHGLMTCGGEDSYGRNVERHAHHHGVRIECYAY